MYSNPIVLFVVKNPSVAQEAGHQRGRLGGSIALRNYRGAFTVCIEMNEDELIRKTVGRPRPKPDVFDRIRKLNQSLERLGVKRNDDGEHIRRVVGPSRR